MVRPAGVDMEEEAWRKQLDKLADSVVRWTGNHAGIVEVPEEDLASLRRCRPPVLDELDEDAITLAGPYVFDVLE